MTRLLLNFWDMLKTSGAWLIASFFLCGILHAVLRPETLQKSLGNKKLSSIIKATLSGMLLPICSCGVVPLSLGLYYSGAYLGPTLAFLVATPIINPAAIILAYAMLGPEIATIYLACGFLLPVLIGMLGNRFGGKELVSPAALALAQAAGQSAPNAPPQKPLWERLKGGIRWGFSDLAVQTCRFILLGSLFAAVLLVVVPPSFIQQYLSSPRIISLLGITLLGAIMYVCALGHIPFIAALVTAGAAPGVAVTFLVSGVATNFPEMVSIWRLIGRRAVIIYTGTLVLFGLGAGYLTNLFLAGHFVPQFDLSGAQTGIQLAGRLNVDFPEWFKFLCALAVLALGLYAWVLYFKQKVAQNTMKKRSQA